MFASFAHHLGAARVSFNGNPTHRARLDFPVKFIKIDKIKGASHGPGGAVVAAVDKVLSVLLARFAGMPVGRAE